MTNRRTGISALTGLSIPAAILVSLISTTVAFAENGNAVTENQHPFGHSTSVGVNFPGASARMFLSENFAAELRGQYQYRILTAGPRLYYYPQIAGMGDSRILPFISIEGAYVSFKGNVSKGNGLAYGANAGMEYFLSRRVSIQADAGPYYIMLNDDSSSIEQTGLEFVMNFGVNFYF